MGAVVVAIRPEEIGQDALCVFIKEVGEWNDPGWSQILDLCHAVEHCFRGAGVPDGHHKGGVGVSMDSRRGRLDWDPIDRRSPKFTVIIAEQNCIDGTGDATTKVASAEYNERARSIHEPSIAIVLEGPTCRRTSELSGITSSGLMQNLAIERV